MKFKATSVGGLAGSILSKEARVSLIVQKGYTLRISPCDQDFKRQMEQAEQLMHDDREILRSLAK